MNGMVNLAQLHAEAVAKLVQLGPVPFTRLEVTCVEAICARSTGSSEGVRARIREEMRGLDVPKYAALISWLSPYGPAVQAPELIGRLAMYLLGHTRVHEESVIPPVTFDRLQG